MDSAFGALSFRCGFFLLRSRCGAGEPGDRATTEQRLLWGSTAAEDCRTPRRFAPPNSTAMRQPLDCASPLALSHPQSSPLPCRLEIVRHMELVDFEAVDRLHHGRRGGALEPPR